MIQSRKGILLGKPVKCTGASITQAVSSSIGNTTAHVHSQPPGTAIPTHLPNSTHRVFPQQRLRNSPLPCYPPATTTEGFSPAVAQREQQQLSRRLQEQSQTAAVTTHSAHLQYLGRDCTPVLPPEWCTAVECCLQRNDEFSY